MAHLKAVFFDAGNTLLHINCRQISDFLRQFGIAIAAEDLKRAEYRARPRISRFLGGTASMELEYVVRRYFDYVLDEAGLGVFPDEGDRIFEKFLSVHREQNLWNEEDPHAKEVLGRLRGRFKLAVISNADGKVEEALEEKGLKCFFDFVLDSAVVGIEKPDPRIFELGLRKAGVKAEEAVYVGDIFSVDILGARRAGIRGILLDPISCYGLQVDCPKAGNLLEVEARVEAMVSGGSTR
jgi:putative hydrolase of the HAD superfamily